jgi:hypothetical protein
LSAAAFSTGREICIQAFQFFPQFSTGRRKTGYQLNTSPSPIPHRDDQYYEAAKTHKDTTTFLVTVGGES